MFFLCDYKSMIFVMKKEIVHFWLIGFFTKTKLQTLQGAPPPLSNNFPSSRKNFKVLPLRQSGKFSISVPKSPSRCSEIMAIRKWGQSNFRPSSVVLIHSHYQIPLRSRTRQFLEIAIRLDRNERTFLYDQYQLSAFYGKCIMTAD